MSKKNTIAKRGAFDQDPQSSCLKIPKSGAFYWSGDMSDFWTRNPKYKIK